MTVSRKDNLFTLQCTYSGLIHKNTSGFPLYRMKVRSEILNEIYLKEVSVRRKSRLAQFFEPWNKPSHLIIQTVKRYLHQIRASSITAQAKLLEMEFDFIPPNFDTLKSIEQVQDELIKGVGK
ncbi:MAG: hypothetical protein AAF632_10020 [Bacteroidota bacterium]